MVGLFNVNIYWAPLASKPVGWSRGNEEWHAGTLGWYPLGMVWPVLPTGDRPFPVLMHSEIVWLRLSCRS